MKMVDKLINKYKNINITIKAAICFVFCSIIQKSISFITVPIFTRIMSPSEYGIYSTYLSWYSIIIILCSLNMYSCVYINDYSKEKSREKRDKIVVPMLTLSILITFIFFILYLVFHSVLSLYIKLPSIIVYLLFFQILFEIPVSFWLIEQRFEYKYKNVLLQTLFFSITNSVLGVVFVIVSNNNQSLARVISIVLTQFIIGSIVYFIFFKRSKKIFSTEGWKHILKVQIPLLPHSLSMIVLSASDRIMINSIISSAEAAIYNVAYSIGYITNVIQISLIDALKPQLYNRIKNNNLGTMQSIISSIMIFLFILIGTFLCFAPELMKFMAPDSYMNALYVIPPVAISTFFIFIYNIFSVISFYFEKTKSIMIASVLSAISNIVLNYIFIPKYGFIAAGYTTLASYILLSIFHFIIMRKTCSNNNIEPKHLNCKLIFILSIFAIFLSVFFNFIYKLFILRTIFILVLISIIFINRIKIINNIKFIIKKGD